MITYDKGWWGNRVLFRVYGSAFPRSLPYACLSAAIAATLSALFHTTGWGLLSNSYPVQMFFFVVGFMVIFRCVDRSPHRTRSALAVAICYNAYLQTCRTGCPTPAVLFAQSPPHPMAQ